MLCSDLKQSTPAPGGRRFASILRICRKDMLQRAYS